MSRRSAGGLLGFVRRLVPPPVADSDADLLARYSRDRDEQAFAELVRRHAGMVHSVCRRRLGDTPDADDAAQAVFVALSRHAGRVRDSLPGWLYRAAYLTALKAAGRAAKRRPVGPPEEVPMTAPPDRPAETAELKAVLDAELAALPDKFRGVVALCLIEGRTNTEAAAVLGVPVGTVDSRLSTARQKLRDRLVRRGVAVAAAVGFEAALPKAGRAADGLMDGIMAAVTGTGPVAAGVSELADGVLPMTTTKAKAAAAVLVGLGLLGSGAGVFLAAGDGPKPDDKKAGKPAAEKKADPPPTVEAIEGTTTTFPNGSVMVKTWPKGDGPLLSAEARKPFDILDKPAGLTETLESMELSELLSKLTADHKVPFRVDENAFKTTGEAAILSKKIGGRFSPAGMTVREVLMAMAVHPDVAVVVRGGQVVVTVASVANQEVGNDINPSVTFVADGKPLAEVAADLRRISGANVVIDGRAAAEAKLPVSGVFNDVRAFTVLTVLADGCELQPVMVDNVIYITTRANAAKLLKGRDDTVRPAGPQVQPRSNAGA